MSFQAMKAMFRAKLASWVFVPIKASFKASRSIHQQNSSPHAYNYFQGLAHLPLLQTKSPEQSFSVEQEAPKTSLDTDMVISISTGTHQRNAQTKSK